MHRTDLTDDQGKWWHVLHNGDWSGDAKIRRADWPCDKEDIIVPGFILRNACRSSVIEDIRGKLEDVLDDLT